MSVVDDLDVNHSVQVDFKKALQYADDVELRTAIMIEYLLLLKKTEKKRLEEGLENDTKQAFAEGLVLIKDSDNPSVKKVYAHSLIKYTEVVKRAVDSNGLLTEEQVQTIFNEPIVEISSKIGPLKYLLEVVFSYTVAVFEYKQLQQQEIKKGDNPYIYSPAIVKFKNAVQRIQETRLAESKNSPYALYVIINEIKEETYRIFKHLHSKGKLQETPDVLAVRFQLFPYGNEKSSLNEAQIIKIVRVFNIENPSAYHFHPHSFESILNEIIKKDEFAKMKFGNGRTWLHYLPLVNLSEEERKKLLPLLVKACQVIVGYGISPYEVDIYGNTAFKYITTSGLNVFGAIYAPNICDGLVGVSKQHKVVNDFFVRAESQDNQERFMLLSGPDGTGKLSLVKKIASKHGFSIKEYDLFGENDIYVAGKALRMSKFFKDHKSDSKTCLLFDNIEATLYLKNRNIGALLSYRMKR